MRKTQSLISYTLAAMAGLFFISGLAVLTSEGRILDEQVGSILDDA